MSEGFVGRMREWEYTAAMTRREAIGRDDPMWWRMAPPRRAREVRRYPTGPYRLDR